ncbi:FIG00554258: hypothetical protein [Cronobacter malonaticus 507]|nr:FIG00554258: hypothetical protein [Cronobacter malonaticus 507]
MARDGQPDNKDKARVMVRTLASFILTVALTLVSVSALAQPLDVPPMRGVINDPADLLSGQEYVALLDDVSAINTRTHAQTAILVLPELKGDNLERFATRTFNTWRLGNAQRNDGVLILVAWHDRLVRIETGRGLQKTIPDALASRVIKEYMLPWFRAGDLTQGLRQGLTGIDALLSHQPLPPATSPSWVQAWLKPLLLNFSYWLALPVLVIVLFALIMLRKKKTLVTLFFGTSCLLTPALAITSNFFPWVEPFLWLSFSVPFLLMILALIVVFAFPNYRLSAAGNGSSSGDTSAAWLATSHLHSSSGGDSASHHSSHHSVSSGDGGSSDGGGSSDNW